MGGASLSTNPSSSQVFTISQVVRLAYRQAMLISDYQNPSDQQSRHARDLLQLLSMHTQTKGLLAHMVGFTEITLVADQYIYTMTSDVLDVVQTAAFIQAGVTDPANGELNVSPMTRDEWQALSAKGAQGVPTLYYVDRTGDNVAVRIWPVPTSSQAGGRIRFQTHHFRANMDTGTYTPDFERYWSMWLVYALAAELALGNALPVERVQVLQAKAQALFQDCRSYGAQRTAPRMILMHRTGYSR